MKASPPLHPSDDVLSAFGLGKLDDDSASGVVKHLESCDECRLRVGELSADSFLGRIRDGRGATAGASRTSAASRSRPDDGIPPGLADHPDYEVKRELGRGGMGVVYLAHNTLMGRDEVLKVMGRHIMEKPGVLDRFLREIRAVARLRHPNIVAAYSAFRLDETIVFAMEYVDGLDLARMVKAKGPMPVSHACNFIYQAALGLEHAREEGTVHRDVKPANLMLSRKGNRPVVKILDFGLAKANSEFKVDHSLTQEGQMLGTPDYMAPEQWVDAQKADIRADIYSLGCSLYYLLSGGPPFRGSSIYDMFQAHQSMNAPALNLKRPEVPVELGALVAKMMAKEPERRFQTPKQAADALVPFFKRTAGSPGVSADVSTDERVAPPPPEPVAPVPDAAEPEPEPAAGRKARKQARPEEMWASLIDFREKEPQPPAPPADAPKPQGQAPPPRRPSRKLVGGGLFGLVLLLGVIVITILNRDGSKTTIKMPSDVPAKVEQDGFSIVVEPAPAAGTPPADEPAPPEPTPIPATAPAQVANTQGMIFRLIPAGWFLMGSPAGQGADSEHPLHTVTISRPFYLGVHEVTQKQYAAVMNTNPSQFRGDDGRPVEQVSWLYAVKFCNALSKLEGLPEYYRIEGYEAKPLGGPGYRLPTEAEWEYACRAGTTGSIPFADPTRLGDHAWYADNAGKATRPVGLKQPNAWGLHDMLGNVREWCQDVFDPDYYRTYPNSDPTGPSRSASPEEHVARGGDYATGNPANLRPAYRGIASGLLGGVGGIGFRVARTPEPDPATARFEASEGEGRWLLDEPAGELVQAAYNTKARILFGDPSWSHYDFSFEARPEAGSEGWWSFFHYNDGENHINFYTGADKNSRMGLGKVIGNRTVKEEAPGWIRRGQWHAVRIEVRGPQAACYVDGKLVRGYQDPGLTKGRVGLGSDHTAVRFRNIRVSTPDGTVLLAGLPRLPGAAGSGAAATPAPSPASYEARVESGTWTIDEAAGELVQSKTGGVATIAFGDPEWSQYDLKFEAKPTLAGREAWSVFFHFIDAENNVNFHTGAYHDFTYGLRTKVANQIVAKDDRNGRIKPGEWHQGRIEVRGPKASIYLDGDLMMEYSDARLTKGRIGFGAYDTTARFRNIEVVGTDGAVLFRGLPRLPSAAEAEAGSPVKPTITDLGAGTPVKPTTTVITPAPAATPAGDGFTSLFNGKDLSGWKVDRGDPKAWSIEGGQLVGKALGDYRGQTWLLSDRSFADFLLRFEAYLPDGVDSGVFLRAEPAEPHSPVEVNLRTAQPPLVPTGAVRLGVDGSPEGYSPPDAPASLRPPPSWNRVEVRLQGDRLTVRVNDRPVKALDLSQYASRADSLAGLRRTRGQVGFQTHTGTVRFRNIEIKELDPPKADRSASARKKAAKPVLPPDAREFNGKHYKVFTNRLTWQEALALCQKGGGHLAIVRDADVDRFLVGLVREKGLREAWIGATDAEKEGVWKWVDGSPMTYRAWGDGQPTNRSTAGEPEHYAALSTVEGGWNDLPNQGEKAWETPGFVCQWD